MLAKKLKRVCCGIHCHQDGRECLVVVSKGECEGETEGCGVDERCGFGDEFTKEARG